ncbi:MAG: phosphoenolpyruvate-utilizing N-terminal domain-containing protein, partial [Planctomycetota bacterium]
MLKGIPVSPGVAVGRVYVCESARDLRHLVEHTTANSPETELMRLRDAARRANRELAQLIEEVRTELGNEEAAIFEAQRAILRDQAVEKEMLEILNQENMSAEKALAVVIEKYAQTVARAHDEHLRHRATDIRDIGQRVLSILLNEDQKDLIAHEEHLIAVTRQAIPSRLVGLMQQKIAGVVSDRGGRTSHSAILCRSYGIPAVTGVRGILDRIKLGDVVALDGSTGEVWLNPDKEILKSLNERRKERSTMWVKLQAQHDEPAHTKDG